jgi:uncharacterized protein
MPKNSASTLAYCIGGCYSEFGCFKRTIHICEITKIQAKMARKYRKKVNDLKQNIYI